jgi:hypothetical protein
MLFLLVTIAKPASPSLISSSKYNKRPGISSAMLHYPISFLLAACGEGRLMNLRSGNADDDLLISLAQQAVAAQRCCAAARDCSYTDGLTLRRIPLSIATPLPHVLAHMTADITRPYAYIANAHDVAMRRMRLHRPLSSLRLKPCSDIPAAVRPRVCSGAVAASLAIRLCSNRFCDQRYCTHSRCAEAITSRIYAVYCGRVQVRRAVLCTRQPHVITFDRHHYRP